MHIHTAHFLAQQTSRRTFLGHTIAGAGIVTVPGLATAMLGHVGGDDRAFFQAVAAGNLAAVRLMLEKAPSLVTARDDLGRSGFAIAGLHQRRDIADLLIAAGHTPDIHEAALVQDWDRFNALADGSPDLVNADHPLGGSTMFTAALGGAGSDMWRVFAKCGEPNTRPGGPSDTSPVRAALEFDDLPAAEMTAATLLSNGADPTLPEPGGRTALHVAAERGSTEMVELLIFKHASVDARTDAGQRPIDLAQHNGHKACVDMLRDHQNLPRECTTSREAFDVDGNTYHRPDIRDLPIIDRRSVVGQSHRNIDAVRAALKGDPRLAHSMATTTERAVEAGAHMGNVAIVNLLLEHGAPYSLPTACMRQDFDRVRELLLADPDRIHERGAHGFALLWYAVIGRGSVAMAELLCELGADVEQQHFLGTTTLHWAVMRDDIDLAAFLIERGADVNRRGRKFRAQGHTPLQFAQGNEKMVTLLTQHGARY